MSDFIELLKAFFIGACIVAIFLAIVYFCCSSCESSHVKSEHEPTLSIRLDDVEYKGHTYILLCSPYGKALVHAEHCKCKK